MRYITLASGQSFIADKLQWLVFAADGFNYAKTASGNIVKQDIATGEFTASSLLEMKPHIWQLPWAKVLELYPNAELEFPETI